MQQLGFNLFIINILIYLLMTLHFLLVRLSQTNMTQAETGTSHTCTVHLSQKGFILCFSHLQLMMMSLLDSNRGCSLKCI